MTVGCQRSVVSKRARLGNFVTRAHSWLECKHFSVGDSVRATFLRSCNYWLFKSRDEWEKISPEVPDKVISLVLNADRLYVATEQRGMFRVSLEKEW